MGAEYMGAQEEPQGDCDLTSTKQAMDVEESVEEVAPEPVVESEPLTLVSALKRVLKNALCHDGLARGIRECARVCDKRTCRLCILAKSCNEPAYKKLIKALCTEHDINLLEVDDGAELGEWAGLCKIDSEGNARKVVSCSCVCITDYGESSAALDFLLKEIESGK